MYQSSQHARRRKKRILQGCKTVTVVRGKLGYGFTISGQNPCMLSCIVPGSPAELAGLKPGDLLYFVNGQNVSRYSHDDVVRMVGLSTGALELQVAENCNNSDSSDDDYPPRSKSRYPNRVRPRQNFVDKGSKYDSSRGVSRQQERKDSGGIHHHTSGDIDSDLSSSLTSQEEPPWPQRTDMDWRGISQERLQPRGMADPSDRQNSGFAYPAMHSSAIRKVSSASAIVKKVPPLKSSGKSAPLGHSQYGRREVRPQAVSKSSIKALPQQQVASKREQSPVVVHEDEMEEDEDLPQVAETVKAVVGYIGSIETPSSHTRPHQRLQALRNAVRRLRVEQRVHTLVLMDVNPEGVVLTNAVGKQLALYPCERIAFSGICPDDKRFFGLVTLSCSEDDASSFAGEGESARLPNSSCHIFMIEPELSSHSAHVHHAEMFQIECTTNPQTRRCDEFPSSATSLILCIANLYRDAPPKKFDNDIVQSQVLADPAQVVENNSNSSTNGNNSNSDSGLGFGKEEAPLEQNEQVCVIDLPNTEKDNSSCSSMTMDTSGLSFQQQLSPESRMSGTPRPPHSTQRPVSAFDVRRGLNNSTSSEEWQSTRSMNRLTPRAMPDPSCSGATPPHPDSPIGPNSAESLRQSMQRLLQARHQQLHEQNRMLGSDGESHAGDPVLSLSVAEDGHAVLETNPVGKIQQPLKDGVFTVPTNPPPHSSHYGSSASGRSAFQVPRPVSAPLGKHRGGQGHPETVDMDAMEKLSPRAFPHTSPPASVFRSPSAPPAPFFPHCDTDDDDDDDDDESEDDPYIRQILDEFSRDRQAAAEEDSRRFSEGFALSKRRAADREASGSGMGGHSTWSKAGSFKHTQQLMKQSFSHSHESLAVGEDPSLNTQHKLIAASVNNITGQAGGQRVGQTDKAGRVASWAVHVDKLLQDPVGIEIFSEFLRREFSEENILFWKACEQYRQLTDDSVRKAQAMDVYNRFLSAKADDPVNVDGAARSYTEKFLDNPTAIMFDVAQQQIYQLMRQDSYARFIKSDLYKNKLMEEMEGRPLQGQSGDRQPEEKGGKKKVKGKENEDKRRRSILPWRQHKKSSMKSTSDPELKGLGKKSNKEDKEKDKDKDKDKDSSSSHNVSLASGSSNGVVTVTTSVNNNGSNNNNNLVMNLKKAPGPGIDLSTMRKEVFHPKETSRDAPASHFKFCRIIMPDGSSTVVCAKPGQTSRSVLTKLCEKRSVSLASTDVFILGTETPLDLGEDISTLGSKEILIERRVLFRLDLPSGKSIGVKAKPNRSIRDVFKPILQKYGHRIENITIHLMDSVQPLDLELQVSELDNKRTVVVEDGAVTEVSKPGGPLRSARTPRASSAAGRAKGGHPASSRGSLEEITNQIFEDLMRGKSQVAHGFDELGVLELDKSKGHKNEEVRSSGLFALLRRESVGQKDNRKGNKTKSKVTFTLPSSENRRTSSSVEEDERLFEMLSNAQRMRLEEQRGVHISTGDLPSFLCQDHRDNERHMDAVEEVFLHGSGTSHPNVSSIIDSADRKSKVDVVDGSRPSSTSSLPTKPDQSLVTPIDSKKTRPLSTPASDKWKGHPDRGFSQNGIIPSPRVATELFRMSPVVVDAKNNTVAQSHDATTSMARHPSTAQSFDNTETSQRRTDSSRLAGNLACHFSDSHSFRPLHRYGNAVKAPVVSPEKFSPESKKLRSSPDTQNILLPNKVSPNTRSSSTSSSVSSGNNQNSRVSPNVGTSPSAVSSAPQGKTVHRLSDTMLVQKLQQAWKEKENRQVGSVNQRNQESGAFQNGKGIHMRKSVSEVEGQLFTKVQASARRAGPNGAAAPQYNDLAQRALLSPRFDQSSPQQRHFAQVSGRTSPSQGATARAVLSPRQQHHPMAKHSDSTPQRSSRTSPRMSPTAVAAQMALISPRYSMVTTSATLAGPTQTLSSFAPPTVSHRDPPIVAGTPRNGGPSPHIHNHHPPYRAPPAYAGGEAAEETVTFV